MAAARSRIEELATLKEEGKLGDLDVATKRRLRDAVRDGDRARKELTQAYLPVVVSIVRGHAGSRVRLLDVVQHGNVALMRAVETFDLSKDIEFATYATSMIREAVSQAVADQARPIGTEPPVVEAIEHLRLSTYEASLEPLGGEDGDAVRS